MMEKERGKKGRKKRPTAMALDSPPFLFLVFFCVASDASEQGGSSLGALVGGEVDSFSSFLSSLDY